MEMSCFMLIDLDKYMVKYMSMKAYKTEKANPSSPVGRVLKL